MADRDRQESHNNKTLQLGALGKHTDSEGRRHPRGAQTDSAPSSYYSSRSSTSCLPQHQRVLQGDVLSDKFLALFHQSRVLQLTNLQQQHRFASVPVVGFLACLALCQILCIEWFLDLVCPLLISFSLYLSQFLCPSVCLCVHPVLPVSAFFCLSQSLPLPASVCLCLFVSASTCL